MFLPDPSTAARLKPIVSRIRRRWLLPLLLGFVLFVFLLSPTEWTEYTPQQPPEPIETCRHTIEIGETGENLCPDNSRLLLITPTYERLTRRPDLIKLKNTLAQVPNLLWILIEDGAAIDPSTEDFLRESPAVPFIYFPQETVKKSNATHRGLDQRNAALDYIRDRRINGVVYFTDDDNAYDLKLFENLRNVTTLSLFSVGGIGRSGVEGPVLDSEGRFVKWVTSFAPGRKYPLDMAAFAFPATKLFENPKIRFYWNTPTGMMETAFMSIIEPDPSKAHFLQPLIDNVRVFHVKTKPIRTPYPKDWGVEREERPVAPAPVRGQQGVQQQKKVVVVKVLKERGKKEAPKA
ncbi:Galactosylgalactosylxylosylprotein 3-beta-glucuronosyltransferase 1 [Rhizophlyctis rosea]|nr:Galactosylgalactosylxylosylprotein 3-beta-glucuronosyltransferase 1 [Rhizophlyctis rosea]